MLPADLRPATDTSSAQELLRRLAAGTADVVGDGFLRTLVRHLAEAFGAELAFVAEHHDRRARVLAAWHHDVELPETLDYPLDETVPCTVVARDGILRLPAGVVARFPNDELVVAEGLDAYVGVALRGADATVVGHLAIMARHRLEPDEPQIDVLRLFAARAAAEVDRRRHMSLLRTRDAEVAAARARVLQAADEERRRIGRDLHDGAQQRVVALAHLIGLARRKLGDEVPDDVLALLERAHDEAQQATGELRELARGLHPAGLSEHGLGPALEALASRAPLPLVVGELPERRLPEPIELSAYYLTSEALTNAVRYANAREVRVDVTQRPDAAVVVVADDGDGGADPSAGSGLRGLEDRVAALGGTLRIDSPPGAGTRLEAWIPLAPWRTAKEPFLEFGHEGDGGKGLERIQRLLDGSRDVSVSLAREWEIEGGLPRIGQQLPVLDHRGRRHGTLEVLRVGVVPFAEVDEIVIPYEASGATSLEEWRESQRRFWELCRDEIALLLGEPGWRLTDEEPMVLTWYRVVPDHEAQADPGADTGVSA